MSYSVIVVQFFILFFRFKVQKKRFGKLYGHTGHRGIRVIVSVYRLETFFL